MPRNNPLYFEAVNLEQFNAELGRIAKATGRTMASVVKQTAIFAAQSAAKATAPGPGLSLSRLPKKNRFRPIGKMPQPWNGWYYYVTPDGKLTMRPKQTSRKDLKEVKYAIVAVNRKTGGNTYLPFISREQAKASSRLKIPNAGAAKAGWLRGLGDLSGKGQDMGNVKNPQKLGRATVRQSPDSITVDILNNCKYVSKISPNSAARGIYAARQRMLSTYLKKLDPNINV